MQISTLHNKSRQGKAKVKSGCNTCRTRKVKCDETFPVCRRCVTAGRVCGGYGIWGGGGNVSVERHSHSALSSTKATKTNSPVPKCLSILIATIDEKECFDWFKCRTANKLPGSFISDFWGTLLMQASISEPAVLHAVLALGSLHRRGVMLKDQTNSIPDEQMEQFTLQHYVEAISYLRPHFQAKDKATFRVVLIVCIVFISLDFLRGYFSAGQIHLQNGLKLLEETEWLSYGKDEKTIVKPSREAIDDWIVEVFARFCLQVELFKLPYPRPCSLFRPEEIGSASIFKSLKDAWRDMDRIMNRIFYLTEKAQDSNAAGTCPSEVVDLLEYQQRIQKDLDHWVATYNEWWKSMKTHVSNDLEKARLLQLMYHAMATIMANTCLFPDDESVYDLHTDKFVCLLQHLLDLWIVTMDSPDNVVDPLPINLVNARSIMDIGWMAPLYYIAVKCRVHRIRLHAVRLLEVTYHREGIWDASITARVSRKVIELEEGDFYEKIETDDDFSLSSSPLPADFEVPTLPMSRRIQDIEMQLSGEPLEKVFLWCKQDKKGMDCRVCVAEYCLSSQCWVDGEIDQHWSN
ncbi:uncharacterized protein LY89DRAFT_596132 [Mollisia scopiformis]|uniref:Zn(2)-C6 fungal-type domain-containing protein n=1 Tax=Mollisia scopiformis TaxID=149040 RepID=A0A194WT82_MOLSC|nr:uncharacterized protein LY89DRAFT_596132 [Mollisia scopiformis]KUJ10884.1 hypothetical protein LY89DRAFT_596132 [Mollisia scopiformis]